MPRLRAGSNEQIEFLGELLSHRFLASTGVPGVYARGALFEQIRHAFDALVSREAASEAPELLRFPPMLPRDQLESSGYLASFPHLAGTVFAFDGDEDAAVELAERARAHEDWSGFQEMTDLVLVPAACYPIYPAIAARGPVPAGGVTVDTGDSYVFRREPSTDPARLQIFHQREIVRIADDETVVGWRSQWRDRARALFRSLELEIQLDVANDPFFGRAGRLLAAVQRDQELKWELVAPVAGTQTAIASSNYHQDHFAQAYGLLTPGGDLAHTACLGFGGERVTLALLSAHGLRVEDWPENVRQQLRI